MTLKIKPTIEVERKEKTELEKVQESAVKELERLGGVTFREDDIVFQGNKLVLPTGMSIEQGITFLNEKLEELVVETDFSKKFKYRPWDVAFCSYNALRRTFGSVSHQSSTVQTFFGPEKAPPRLIDIHTDHENTVSVPWGDFKIPYLPDVLFTLGATRDDDHGVVGVMSATGPKRWRYAVHGVFNLIEKELEEASLYRGKAFDGRENPAFLDLSLHRPEKMVFAKSTEVQLQASLWGAIKHREALRRVGVPFKRAILLSGGFGVGKSVSINETGRVCQQEGITFILVRPGRDDLREALMTARIYQPSVVAFEDVDTVAAASDDTKRISEVLDLFDGIEAKNAEVMLVLTTNHQERLHRGMLRPGRLDAIIEIGAPDAEGIRKLIEVNISNLDKNIDWSAVTDSMEGYLPAFVVEAGQRAMRYVLVRGGDPRAPITGEDLVEAANGLRSQFALMAEASEGESAPELDSTLKRLLDQAVQENLRILARDVWDSEINFSNR